MIQKFNSKQTLKAVIAAILCLVATVLTFVIAHAIWQYVVSAFGFDHLAKVIDGVKFINGIEDNSLKTEAA